MNAAMRGREMSNATLWWRMGLPRTMHAETEIGTVCLSYLVCHLHSVRPFPRPRWVFLLAVCKIVCTISHASLFVFSSPCSFFALLLYTHPTSSRNPPLHYGGPWLTDSRGHPSDRASGDGTGRRRYRCVQKDREIRSTQDAGCKLLLLLHDRRGRRTHSLLDIFDAPLGMRALATLSQLADIKARHTWQHTWQHLQRQEQEWPWKSFPNLHVLAGF